MEVRKRNESIRWKSEMLYVVKPSQLPIHLQRKKKHQPFPHTLWVWKNISTLKPHIKILHSWLAFCMSLMLILFIKLSQLLKNYSWCSSAIKLNIIPYLAKTQNTSLFILTISTCWHCLRKMSFNFIQARETALLWVALFQMNTEVQAKKAPLFFQDPLVDTQFSNVY